jgi:feruloyl esterase
VNHDDVRKGLAMTRASAALLLAVLDRTRPLCPDPQSAVYKGAGSIDEAACFTCR